VVGPWRGEVGFELLYWVPFVRWVSERYRIDPSRLIVVSRGGAAAWYGSVAATSADALAFMGPEEFKIKNDARNARFGEQKQLGIAPIDEEIIDRVRRERRSDVAVLHPSLMYRLFAPYWWGHRGLEWVHRRARFARLAAPAVPLDLPDGYTAVKFYFNDCFRNTPATRAFVERRIRELEREGPVVLLSPGVAIDDHAPCDPQTTAARGIRHLISPPTNLLVQSAVVARARRFVGTYGGFAYLAPFYGVTADSYFSEPGAYSVRHLQLAQDVFSALDGAGRLTVAPVADAAPAVAEVDA
jgi:hypothetical protein